jgi:diguanylate cyclase (GGDEF)-like protein/PAS domain S-box-containing protein
MIAFLLYFLKFGTDAGLSQPSPCLKDADDSFILLYIELYLSNNSTILETYKMTGHHVKGQTRTYRLSELLDMSMLQTLAESNFRAGGLPMSIIDAFDTSILVSAGWQDICTKFHRANPLSLARCVESDEHAKSCIPYGETYQYKCRNGLWHIATPVVVDGRHLATMFLTQFHFEGEGPDREFFIRQAHEFGYHLDGYLEALDNMPVFSAEKVDYILAYDQSLVRFISYLAEQSLKTIETRKSLSRSEDKYRSVVNNINIGIYRNTAGQGRFNRVNPAMAKIFGFDSIEEFMNISVVDLYQNAGDRKKFIEEVKQKGFVRDREIDMKKKDGTPICCSITATAQYSEDGEIKWMDGVAEDITERKQAEERLQTAYDELDVRVKERTADLAEANEMLVAEISERKRVEGKLRELSERDHLTMIYNRRKLFELLASEVEKAKRYTRPLSIIMLDIDHFKKVNDNYGHNIGDTVLKTTANIIAGVIRKVDIFARYGGEEFMIISPETNIEGAVVLAEKIRISVEKYFYPAIGGVTISAGVAELSGNNSGAAFIKNADDALYAAKNRGRNRVETSSLQP